MMNAVCSQNLNLYAHLLSGPQKILLITFCATLYIYVVNRSHGMHYSSASTRWPRGHHRALLLHLSQRCLSTRAFGICGAARNKQQTVLWRCKSRPAQVFQIKVLTSSSTKMHGADTFGGSNTFCGSGVVFRTANHTTSQVQTMAWSASRTHHQLKRWTVKSVWVAAKKQNSNIKIQITFMQTCPVML